MERLHISDTCPQYYCGFLSDTQQQLHINRSNTLLCVHLENNQEHKAYICGLFCGGETCNRKDLRHFEKKVMANSCYVPSSKASNLQLLHCGAAPRRVCSFTGQPPL